MLILLLRRLVKCSELKGLSGVAAVTLLGRLFTPKCRLGGP